MAQADLYSKGQIDTGFITSDGQTPWLKKIQKKAPFAVDTALVSPIGQAQLNSTGNVHAFPRKFDVCFGCRIQMSLPALTAAQLAVGSTTTYAYELTDRADLTTDHYAVMEEVRAGVSRSVMAGYWVRWVPAVGHAILTEVRFLIAGQPVTKLTGDLLNCLESTIGKKGQKQMDMIGSFHSQEQAVLWASNAHKAYVDVPLWFTEDVSVALILAAVSLNTVTIEFDTRAITDIVLTSNPDINALNGAVALSNTSVGFKMIFRGAQVSAKERKVYMNHGQHTDVMMKDWQSHTFSSSDSVFNKAIPLVGPISTILWNTQMQNNKTGKDWFNYSSYIPQDGTIGATSTSGSAGETVPALTPMRDMTGQFALDQLLVDAYTAMITTESGLDRVGTEGIYDVSIVSKSGDIYGDWKLEANGNDRHQVMDSDYFRTCSYHDYGYAAPQTQIYMITFSTDPFSTDYNGAMNVSKMDHVYLIGNVTTSLDSTNTIGAHIINVHGCGRNFLTYKHGGAGKTYQ
jgi:hypothetical protein